MRTLGRILTVWFALLAMVATAQETVRTVDTVAELISRPASAKGAVHVLGRASANDGGGGVFWFEPASTTTTNLGTIFKPTSGSGRWKAMITDSTVNVRMFGAKGDGSTDDSTAFQAALDWRDPATGRPGTVLVPAGTYRVSGLVGSGGKLKGVGNVERGSDVATKTASILEHVLGATNDLLTVNSQSGGGGPSMIIEDLLFLGHPEYNLRDAKTITAVYSGDRLHFDVASAPSIEGAKGSQPYLGFGALFTDENRYLGTFMLQSFITNGAGGASTNTVNVATGTDAYATVSGETTLRTGFKVCFPKSATWYSNGSSFGARSFSHMAGYSAIVLWDADECLIRNVKCVNWHTGIAVDSGSYVLDGYESYNCHLSPLIAEPFGFLADATVYGFVLLNGRYQLDDALVPNSYTLKNTVYRSSAVAFGALGAQAKIDNVVAGPSALYGAFLYGGTHSHINNLLIEAPAGVPLYFPTGNSVAPQSFTSIARLRVLSGYAADVIPDNRRTDLALVEVNTQAACIAIGQMSVAPFTTLGTSTNWTWAYVYKWPSTSTDTLLGIGQFEDPVHMVPYGSHKPGGSYNQQRWRQIGGVQTVGGAATEPIQVWARDVAEPNANKVGITYSGGAKLLYAHNGDGIVDDVGYTLESNSSATQLTLGDLTGAASPRTGIIQGEPALGSNLSGGATQIRSGTSTGTGNGSAISFYTPTVGSSGSSAQTQTLRLTIGQGGQLTFAGLTADPSVGTATGSLYYNSSSNSFRWHNGTSWANLGSGGGSGTGDVVGPASAADNALVRYDTTTGKLVQASATQLDDSGNLTLDAGAFLGFGSSGTNSADVKLGRLGTGILGVRNGTSAQQVRVYNTDDGAGNAEWVSLDWGTLNTLTLATGASGTGSARPMQITGGTTVGITASSGAITLQPSGALQLRSNGANNRWQIPTTGHFQPNFPNTFDLGASGAELKSAYIATSVILSSGATIGWNADTFLVRNAANTVAQRNSTTAQRTQVFNTYTDASNGEWFDIDWTTSANKVRIGSNKNGTGSTRVVEFIAGGTAAAQFDASGNLIPATNNGQSTGQSGNRWNSVFVQTKVNLGSSGADVVLTGEASAVLQLGQDAATAATQTIKAFDGSGTDKDGSDLSTSGGKPTGTGRGGSVLTQTGLTSTTGSSLGSYSTREYASAKFVDLTETTDTQIFTVTVGTLKYLGATVTCTVNAADATDCQALTSTLNINAVNKAGTITKTLTQTDGTTAATTGTLTCTYTVTDNGSGVLGIKVNATSSLTQTQLRAKWMVTALNSDDVATITPN